MNETDSYTAESFDCDWDMLLYYSQCLAGMIKSPTKQLMHAAFCFSSMILCAFSFESFLNGALHKKYGEKALHFENLNYKGKIHLIVGDKFDEKSFSKWPFQTLITIFDFRNAQAHSKVVFAKGIYEMGDDAWSKEVQKRWQKTRKLLPSAEEAVKFNQATLECIRTIERLGNIEVKTSVSYTRK